MWTLLGNPAAVHIREISRYFLIFIIRTTTNECYVCTIIAHAYRHYGQEKTEIVANRIRIFSY